MTVSSTSQSIIHNCNGLLVEFPFSFSVGEGTDIKVILTDLDENQTVLVNSTHYTVTGIANDWDISGNPIGWDYSTGGTVTTVATYADGNTLLITTNIPLTQEKVFTEGMNTLFKLFENGLDKLTRICKELDARVGVIELIAFIGGEVTPGEITYLGRLSSDPDTSGWGIVQAFTMWYNTTDFHGKYWNGSEVVIF